MQKSLLLIFSFWGLLAYANEWPKFTKKNDQQITYTISMNIGETKTPIMKTTIKSAFTDDEAIFSAKTRSLDGAMEISYLQSCKNDPLFTETKFEKIINEKEKGVKSTIIVRATPQKQNLILDLTKDNKEKKFTIPWSTRSLEIEQLLFVVPHLPANTKKTLLSFDYSTMGEGKLDKSKEVVYEKDEEILLDNKTYSCKLYSFTNFRGKKAKFWVFNGKTIKMSQEGFSYEIVKQE